MISGLLFNCTPERHNSLDIPSTCMFSKSFHVFLQVPEKTALILIEAGFRNEYKGLTKVKGKEPMKTYLILPPPLETVSCDNG